jgi:hypothetical protein
LPWGSSSIRPEVTTTVASTIDFFFSESDRTEPCYSVQRKLQADEQAGARLRLFQSRRVSRCGSGMGLRRSVPGTYQGSVASDTVRSAPGHSARLPWAPDWNGLLRCVVSYQTNGDIWCSLISIKSISARPNACDCPTAAEELSAKINVRSIWVIDMNLL